MFRGVITGIYIDAGTSEKVCIWVLPLYFAYAHVHALYKQRHLPWDRFQKEILIKVLQVTYTHIFGLYSAWIFIRTKSLWAAIVLHGHCNHFGLPHFGDLFDNSINQYRRIMFAIAYIIGVILFFGFKDYFI